MSKGTGLKIELTVEEFERLFAGEPEPMPDREPAEERDESDAKIPWREAVEKELGECQGCGKQILATEISIWAPNGYYHRGCAPDQVSTQQYLECEFDPSLICSCKRHDWDPNCPNPRCFKKMEREREQKQRREHEQEQVPDPPIMDENGEWKAGCCVECQGCGVSVELREAVLFRGHRWHRRCRDAQARAEHLDSTRINRGDVILTALSGCSCPECEVILRLCEENGQRREHEQEQHGRVYGGEQPYPMVGEK